MIKIEIKPSQVKFDTRSGTSARTGKAYSMNEQHGYAWLGGDYPELIKINLEDGQPPHPAGMYFMHDSSFRVGDFNRLQVARVVLVPADK